MEAVEGAIVTDTSAGAVTASVVDPLIPVIVALMLVVPTVIAVAKPPAVIADTEGTDELHVTEDVRSCELPSLKVPVA